ncbi:MAG: 3-phosphoshikimate 1-carboxyvinyltransferase [Planctomycetota bacterium]|nr:3-phosphoshikimate 1-carboxyvinyltransferase [Planctomycetota bacterium]
MELHVHRSARLAGTVAIPPNKSHSFRALIMAALGKGVSRILSPAVSNDWMRGIEAFEMFGAQIHPKAEGVWEVTGTGGVLHTPEDIVDCGNSGIILRFFAALAACCPGYTVLSGDHSIRHLRLCQPLIDALGQLGAWAVSTKGDGHAPLVVRGPLKGGQAQIDGLDSQPVSALLIAAAMADGPSEIHVLRPGEKPWVGLTLEWLKRCGVEFSNDNYELFRVRGHHRWGAFETIIPLDWSAALYPVVAALVCPDSVVKIPGMDFADTQGDKGVVNILRDMGAQIEIAGNVVTASTSALRGREIDCNDFIDQLPLLAVVGALAEGETRLVNAEVCRHKECDRITATAQALQAMGADVAERPDGLVIRHSRLRGAVIDSQADHRMVMTFAVAALAAEGRTLIKDSECVRKTFPHFVEEMRKIGAEVGTE